jgi:uncharacterized membrane protein YfcA
LLTTILFFLAALICEILGTLGGFGSSVFFVPVAQFFYSFQLVLGITSLLHVFSNISKLLLFGKHINYRLMYFYGVPGVLLVLAGAYFTTQVKLEFAQLALGIFLVLFSIVLLYYDNLKLKATQGSAVISGGLAGLIAGFCGTGGAIRGISMAAFALPKSVFVATSAAIDLGIDVSRSIVYVQHNYFTRDLLWMLPYLMVISYVGSYIGKKWLERIPEATFRKVVLLLVLSVGSVILYQEISLLLYGYLQ